MDSLTRKEQIMERPSRESRLFDVTGVIDLAVVPGVLLCLMLCVLPEAFSAPLPSRPQPVIISATQIRGPDGAASCGGGYDFGVGLVDLDNGLGAGATTYDHGGTLWCETYAPYLWSEQDGGSTLCALEGDYNWQRSTYIPSGITADGTKMVGGVIFFDTGTSMPWTWTADGAPLQLLALPNGYTGGNAVGVSNDRRIVAGNVRVGRTGVTTATVWRDGRPLILPSTQLWSAVGSNPFDLNIAYTARRTHPMNSDGSVIVGATGAAFLANCKATKWVNGVEKQLCSGGTTLQSSVAVFVADSGVIFGYAVLSNGRVVLMRWGANGTAEMFVPPNGLTVVNLSSVDSQGNAAGGALAQQFSCASCSEPACNRKPFVWTRRTGFRILPENGLEEAYNTSTVQDVSDDGRVAVGQLSTCVVGPGSPPQVGFAWRADSGLVLVDDLMAAFGQPDPHYYTATDASRDGNRVLVVGNPRLNDPQDTPDVTLDLAWPTPSPIRSADATKH